MEEQPSFHEKDNSSALRLSESWPKFKPVLVKKLLEDESDDESDDNGNQASNTDNSDDDSDNNNGCEPLPEECTNELTVVKKTHINVTNSTEHKEVSSVSSDVKPSSIVSCTVVNSIEVDKINDKNVTIEDSERRLVSNLAKEPLLLNDYAAKKSEEDKLLNSGKRKSSRDLSETESMNLQSRWQSQMVLDKRKSLTVREQTEPSAKSKYSPKSKRLSQNIINHISEGKDRPIQQYDTKDSQESSKYSSSNISTKDSVELKRYSSTIMSRQSSSISSETSDEKTTISSKVVMEQASNLKNNTAHSLLNNTHGIIDTPMKQPQGSTRPNPCHSHRNIFQTPQNKLSNEFTKNPVQQTPATIFSHWSQQHMAQTPRQNEIPCSRESIQNRENMQTPATTCISGHQSQSAKADRPRYYSVESKSVRRPLAEAMFSAPIQGSQLSRLQEVANESSPPITKESSSNVIQESLIEKKPSFNSTTHTTFETKENNNPNVHGSVKNEIHAGNQQVVKSECLAGQSTLSVQEHKNSFGTQCDSKPKLDYHGNVYPTNSKIQNQKEVENYNSYKRQENQSVHPPLIKQTEQLPAIQYSIAQQSNAYTLRNNRIITVKDQKYLVLSVIGHGMSCEVVRAQDLSNSDLRAIKCVNLTKMDKESVEGCLQEICMLDKLKAPCVVHMYSFEVKQPWIHVVMEIGDTDLSRLLKSMLAEKKKIPLTMILYYWTEMLTAVKHIHDNGVIHSDLKPANFLLVRGRLKLIDFGIASSINSDSTSVMKNCSIGTLNYVSPEALMDVNAGSDSPNHNVKYKISYRSDVWSLGCILYSLVYGVTPFNHIRQQWGKISAITDPKHKINFPLVNGSEPVPLILIDVLRKCLQREPKVRPTVAELLEIPYLEGNISRTIVPNIPSNILIKIKQSLTDEEWKQFSAAFSTR